MATYVVGDVQGCYETLLHLLDEVSFKRKKDRLWLAGDVVNRGPQSAEVIRFVMGLGDAAVSVMGNHELNVLATAAGLRKEKDRDTMSQIFDATDADKLLEWICERPLAHHEDNVLMVHAGIHPLWDVQQTLKSARQIEKRLKNDDWQTLWALSKRKPPVWTSKLKGDERDAAALSVLIGVRMMDRDYRLIDDFAGHPKGGPEGAKPWFKLRPNTFDAQVVFGHWATLGLRNGKDFIGLDTGCVWGGELTCLCLESGEFSSVKMRD